FSAHGGNDGIIRGLEPFGGHEVAGSSSWTVYLLFDHHNVSRPECAGHRGGDGRRDVVSARGIGGSHVEGAGPGNTGNSNSIRSSAHHAKDRSAVIARPVRRRHFNGWHDWHWPDEKSRKVAMVQVPSVFDVHDFHVGSVAAGHSPGVLGIHAIGRGGWSQVTLLWFVVGNHRQGGRPRNRQRDFDDLQ